MELERKQINQLNSWLIQQKRYEDLEHAATDAAFQKQLLEEYRNIN